MKNLKPKNKESSQSKIEFQIEKGEKELNNDESPYYDDISAINMNYGSSSMSIPKNQRINQQSQKVRLQSPNVQPTMLQYKIQQMLINFQRRQEEYQKYIKKKHEQSYEMTQNYLKSLKRYKEQLDKHIEEKSKKKQAKYQKYKANKVLKNQTSGFDLHYKQKLEAYNPSMYEVGLNNIGNLKVDLKCTLSLKYFLPIVDDYLKEKFPQNLDVEIKLPIKNKYLCSNQKSSQIIQVSVRLDQDDNQNIEYLINGYPFSLVPSGDRNGRQIGPNQGENMSYEFTILNEQDNIESFEKGKVWINIYNRDSQILYAYSSISASQLLYYHKESTISHPIRTEQTEILHFYSPHTHLRNSLLHFKLQTQPSYVQENANRVESNEPMELARINVDRNLYGDKESRLIQRINKFKTATNSVLMRPDPHYLSKQADKEEFFKNTNDKTLIEHRKRKELETINKYKQEHKSEYMEKLFDQALQKFSLQQVELGCPKFLVFYFEKQRSGHQRIHPKTTLKIPTNLQNSEDIRKQIEIKLIEKKLAQRLLDKGLIKLKQGATIDVELNEMDKNNPIIDIYDSRVALILKVMVYPTLKMEQLIQSMQDKLRFDVCLRIDSQNGQLLSQQVFKLKPIKLNSQYELSFHNYEYEQEEICIPLNIQSSLKEVQLQTLMGQIQVIASADVEYRISNSRDILDLKVKFPKTTQTIDKKTLKNRRQIQITLLDKDINFLLAAYKIRLFSYHKMKEITTYTIGEICQYCFDLSIDEQINLLSPGKSKNSIQSSVSSLVGFYTSHINECSVFCNSKKQILLNNNQTYKMQVTYQSFSMQSPQDRVIIHMIDLNSGMILKRWLLKIQKSFQDYRSINKVKVKFNKVLKYKYMLKNKMQKQAGFKFFSSNHSIMSVPEFPVMLNEGQQTSVQLSIIVKRQELSLQEKQNGIPVIIRVEQSLENNGWNELFRILVD